MARSHLLHEPALHSCKGSSSVKTRRGALSSLLLSCPSIKCAPHRYLRHLHLHCSYNPNGLNDKPTIDNAVTQNSADPTDLVSWW